MKKLGYAKPELASNKIPTLLTRLGSANDEINYINLTKRILNDVDFANKLILEQNGLYTKLTDPQHIWDLILTIFPIKLLQTWISKFNMKAIILAGGFGTRISEESHLKPKPMIEIGGKPILWHIMKCYGAFGINEFVICCGYKGYVMKEYLPTISCTCPM